MKLTPAKQAMLTSKKAVAFLRYRKNYSLRKIAKELNISKSTVKNYLDGRGEKVEVIYWKIHR